MTGVQVKQPEHGELVLMKQFSPDDHIRANDVISFWQGEGCSTVLVFRDKVWLLYVYNAPRQFRAVRYCKSDPTHNQPDSWHYV